MGDFEVLFNYSTVILLGVIIFNIINSFSFRSILNRFGSLKLARKDFYECGFRPNNQEPVRLSIQFMLICIFFLLYDIELVFLFPYVSGLFEVGLHDFFLIVFFFTCFLCSLVIDYERHALYWQK
jgi:NADH-quinone oxidoreductase subunit A